MKSIFLTIVLLSAPVFASPQLTRKSATVSLYGEKLFTQQSPIHPKRAPLTRKNACFFGEGDIPWEQTDHVNRQVKRFQSVKPRHPLSTIYNKPEDTKVLRFNPVVGYIEFNNTEKPADIANKKRKRACHRHEEGELRRTLSVFNFQDAVEGREPQFDEEFCGASGNKELRKTSKTINVNPKRKRRLKKAFAAQQDQWLERSLGAEEGRLDLCNLTPGEAWAREQAIYHENLLNEQRLKSQARKIRKLQYKLDQLRLGLCAEPEEVEDEEDSCSSTLIDDE